VVSVKRKLEVHDFAFELEGLEVVWGDHGRGARTKKEQVGLLSGSGVK
jgi:hypothetical protein